MNVDTLRNEMSALFAICLPVDVASRFSTLLSAKPSHWSKIDPWRVWQEVDSESVTEWRGDIQSLLASPPLSKYSSAQVTLLRCGHDKPLLQRLSLSEALLGASAVFEGFVSVVPGKLGLAINHDRMVCVLSTMPNTSVKRDAAR
jgi:hypothetical protein